MIGDKIARDVIIEYESRAKVADKGQFVSDDVCIITRQELQNLLEDAAERGFYKGHDSAVMSFTRHDNGPGAHT